MKQNHTTVRFYRKRLPHWEVVDGRYFVTIRIHGAIPKAGQQRIRSLRKQYEEAIDNGQQGFRERRAIFIEMERWLDRADSVDYLSRPHIAKTIVEAIAYREHAGVWTMLAYTIMPNHVHLFFRLGSSDWQIPSRCPDPSVATARPSSRHVESASGGSTCPLRQGTSIRRPTPSTDGLGVPTSKEPDSISESSQRQSMEKVLRNFKTRTARKANRILGHKGQFWQREWFDHWSRSHFEDNSIEQYIFNNPVKAKLVDSIKKWPYSGGSKYQ